MRSARSISNFYRRKRRFEVEDTKVVALCPVDTGADVRARAGLLDAHDLPEIGRRSVCDSAAVVRVRADTRSLLRRIRHARLWRVPADKRDRLCFFDTLCTRYRHTRGLCTRSLRTSLASQPPSFSVDSLNAHVSR